MLWVFDNTVKSPNQTNLETYFVSVPSITWANESPSLDKPVQNMVSVSYKINSRLMCTYQRSHTKLIYSYTSKASRLAPESKTSSLMLLTISTRNQGDSLPRPPTKNSGRVSLTVLGSRAASPLGGQCWEGNIGPQAPFLCTPPCQHRDRKTAMPHKR